VRNAVRYTPEGTAVEVALRKQNGGSDNFAVISVRDRGNGVPEDALERIFRPFYRTEDARDRQSGGGTGLGLAITERAVRMHGGSVEAFSEGPGKGSEFRVTLPARLGARAARAVEAGRAGPLPAERPRDKRGLILIADDNVDAGWGIARLLEIAGFTTLHVRGGIEAVKEARRRRPDAAIVDIGMPDLNGHEVARQIRQNEWGRQMVLIAATGWGQESDKREALESGFDAHMTKPVDLRKLSATVDELLLKKRAG